MPEYLCDRLMKHTIPVLRKLAEGFGAYVPDKRLPKRKIAWIVAGAMLAEGAGEPDPKPRRHWYALEVYPKCEIKARKELLRQAKIQFLNEEVGRILIPRYRNVELRKGTRVVLRRRRFRNYLLIHAIDCPEVRELVRRCRFTRSRLMLCDEFDEEGFAKTNKDGEIMTTLKKVRSLLNLPNRPVKLSDEEAERILREHRESADRSKDGVKTGFKPGDPVKMVDCMYEGLSGKVVVVNGEGTADPVVKVEVFLVGRPVVVALKSFQVSLED